MIYVFDNVNWLKRVKFEGKNNGFLSNIVRNVFYGFIENEMQSKTLPAGVAIRNFDRKLLDQKASGVENLRAREIMNKMLVSVKQLKKFEKYLIRSCENLTAASKKKEYAKELKLPQLEASGCDSPPIFYDGKSDILSMSIQDSDESSIDGAMPMLDR